MATVKSYRDLLEIPTNKWQTFPESNHALEALKHDGSLLLKLYDCNGRILGDNIRLYDSTSQEGTGH